MKKFLLSFFLAFLCTATLSADGFAISRTIPTKTGTESASEEKTVSTNSASVNRATVSRNVTRKAQTSTPKTTTTTSRSVNNRKKTTGATLSDAVNTVGRSAPTSGANVQIVTDDHYMSREHAIIKMTRVANGCLKALISNHKNKHATIVAGQELLKDDELVLTNGINIKMGNTTLVYFEE